MCAYSPKKEYQTIQEITKILDFHRYPEDYVLRPPYQRKSVWSVKKQQSLLESLFRRYYVPRIVLREVRLDVQTTKKEVIDGQQRINAVTNFFANKLSLPKTLSKYDHRLPGKRYENSSNKESSIRWRCVRRELTTICKI